MWPIFGFDTQQSFFVQQLKAAMDFLDGGKVYFIVDNVSKDKTLELCREAGEKDPRFNTIWAPENRNVVDAYMRGLKEAVDEGHEIIIEIEPIPPIKYRSALLRIIMTTTIAVKLH